MVGNNSPVGVSTSPNGHIKAEQSQASDGTPKTGTNTAGQPRQKRKKARRACLQCQRAHLTCSDERPCHRCIKRGLQAECQDGMRKKAKYLHDAPNEALVPGAEQTFKFSHDKNDAPIEQRSSVAVGNNTTAGDHSQTFQSGQPMNYSNFAPNMEASPSMSSQFQTPVGYSPYGNQTSPMQAQVHPQPQLPAPVQTTGDNQPFGTTMFDVNEPTIHFDLAGMNFGNHYGALEFGMLGQIAGGRRGSVMQRNDSGSFESPSQRPSSYMGDSPGTTNMFFNTPQSALDFQGQPQSDDWALLPNIQDQHYSNNNFIDQPTAFDIAAMGLAIPTPNPQSNDPGVLGYYDQAMALPTSSRPTMTDTIQPRPQQNPPLTRQTPEIAQRGHDGPNPAISQRLDQIPPQVTLRQRRREPSSIYQSVTAPYAYTTGFHTLIDLLGTRFKTERRVRIAKALASIRPSFISCTRNLTTDDLVFMEKCFQRQLVEYEELVDAIGTPTIVCRRTGEVAYAAKEFSLMTGWSSDILLGHEVNLNVNKPPTAESNTGTMSGSSRGGMNTPLMPADRMRTDPGKPRPVLLPELMDDKSVVEFFEDFAKLAFADSKGSACRPCKLIKYRTKEQLTSYESPSGGRRKRAASGGPGARKRSRKQGVEADHQDPQERTDQITQLGDKDGKIDCMYCWTVKRDVFDIPLMIVINFLPINTH